MPDEETVAAPLPDPPKPEPKRPGKDTEIRQKDAARIAKAEEDEDEAKAEVRETRKKLDDAKDAQIASLKEDRDSWRKLAIRVVIGATSSALVLVTIVVFAAVGLSRGSIKLPGGFGEISLESADEVANDVAESGAAE